MGQYQSRLKSLADDQLLSGLASIVRRRNQITAEFLAYLAELDERQLFLDLGFSSLFEYCVETLKLCESTAGRHIAAARVCRKYPEAFALVASGALHASALSFMKKYLTTENAAELFELCTHRSARQVEELLAARFPRPDVRDLVRRLPARSGDTLNAERSLAPASTATPSRVLTAETGPTVIPLREPQAELGLTAIPSREPLAEPAKAAIDSSPREQSVEPKAADGSKQRRFDPLAVDRYGVHFTADGEFCVLLERVRGLAGHRLPSGDLLSLLKRGLEAYERELEKERFAVGRKTRCDRNVALAGGRSARKSELNAADVEMKPDCSAAHVLMPDRSAAHVLMPDRSALDASNPERPISAPRRERATNPKRARRYAAAVRRAVFLRDGRQCSYVSSDGRRCNARRCLELDHVDPFALGGEGTVENLRLRCRAHNQRYARQYFGVARVDAAIQNSRRRRAARGD